MLIDDFIKILTDKKNSGNTIFVCGNGGSASNAEHFTNDLFSRGFKAICLNSNVSIITMIANDYGYQYIFRKQLEVFAQKGDLLIVISCSGTSPNITEAVDLGMETCTIFGGSGSYGDMESDHLKLMHQIVERLGDKSI